MLRHARVLCWTLPPATCYLLAGVPTQIYLQLEQLYTLSFLYTECLNITIEHVTKFYEDEYFEKLINEYVAKMI